MKGKIKYLVLALVIIFAGAIFLSSYQEPVREFVTNKTVEVNSGLFFTYEATRYPSNVNITEPIEGNITIGVVVDPWNLNFGMIPTGGNFGKRILILTNQQEKDVRVSLKAYGNIKPMVEFEKNDFILGKSKNTTIDIILRTTGKTEIGDYTGEIDVSIKIPKYGFAYMFL